MNNLDSLLLDVAHALYTDTDAHEQFALHGVDTVCGDGTLIMKDGRAFRVALVQADNPFVSPWRCDNGHHHTTEEAAEACPPPGTPEAMRRGCTCPVVDNTGSGPFWFAAGCPLHPAE